MIETDRFILREFHADDVRGLFELDSDPEVHRYLGGNPISTEDEAARVISFIQEQYRKNGIARWAIIDKQSLEFMGWCGLKWITSELNGRVHLYDLGYRIIRRHWRRGIATEAAKACLQYAFQVLRTDCVYAIADCENVGSNAILNGLGMENKGQFVLDGKMHNWYELPLEKFLKLNKSNQ